MNNLFVSKTYQDIWVKHFIDNEMVTDFDCIKGLRFFKSKGKPFFVNIGENMTNGITYQLEDGVGIVANSVLMIHDVPSYHKVKIYDNRFKLKKVTQYRGYLLDIEQFNEINDFLKKQFNKRSRAKFRNYFNRLEKNHQVLYKVYDDKITHQNYEVIMKQFKDLLKNRFDDLGMENDILLKWEFYYELIYEMVKEKQAVLNTISIDGKLGAISLVFISGSSIIGAVKAFDITYKQYSLGVLELLKSLEWCIDSKYKFFDFSKGNQAYKKRFADNCYTFDVHLLYDSKSIKAQFVASALSSYFTFKQFLRNNNINSLYWKLRHNLG